MSAGILLRELDLDLVIGEAIQVSGINLIQCLPALLGPLDVLGCLDGPEILLKSEIAKMTLYRPLEPAGPHDYIVNGDAVDVAAKLPDK